MSENRSKGFKEIPVRLLVSIIKKMPVVATTRLRRTCHFLNNFVEEYKDIFSACPYDKFLTTILPGNHYCVDAHLFFLQERLHFCVVWGRNCANNYDFTTFDEKSVMMLSAIPFYTVAIVGFFKIENIFSQNFELHLVRRAPYFGQLCAVLPTFLQFLKSLQLKPYLFLIRYIPHNFLAELINSVNPRGLCQFWFIPFNEKEFLEIINERPRTAQVEVILKYMCVEDLPHYKKLALPRFPDKAVKFQEFIWAVYYDGDSGVMRQVHFTRRFKSILLPPSVVLMDTACYYRKMPHLEHHNYCTSPVPICRLIEITHSYLLLIETERHATIRFCAKDNGALFDSLLDEQIVLDKNKRELYVNTDISDWKNILIECYMSGPERKERNRFRN